MTRSDHSNSETVCSVSHIRGCEIELGSDERARSAAIFCFGPRRKSSEPEFDVHELSICQALLTQVAEVARRQGAEVVERITIELGPLSGVEPSLLSSAFSIMRLNGVASNATLHIESIGVSILCVECGAETATRANYLICRACGGLRTRVIAGDELCLRRIEMRMPQSDAASAACL